MAEFSLFLVPAKNDFSSDDVLITIIHVEEESIPNSLCNFQLHFANSYCNPRYRLFKWVGQADYIPNDSLFLYLSHDACHNFFPIKKLEYKHSIQGDYENVLTLTFRSSTRVTHPSLNPIILN